MSEHVITARRVLFMLIERNANQHKVNYKKTIILLDFNANALAKTEL